MQHHTVSYTQGFKNRTLWLIFIAYSVCVGLLSPRHEPWGDELQTWDHIKESGSFFNLLANTHFDGHPPLWYSVLFVVSKFTHELYVIQFVAFITACAVAFLFIFYSKFPVALKIIALSGYYFMFEYSLFSRNYAIAVFIAFLLCMVIHRDFKYKNLAYYVLLFLLSNAHFFALFLAVSFHLVFLYSHWEKNKKPAFIWQHGLLGMAVLMFCICFVFLPSELAPGSASWLKTWDKGRLFVAMQAPLRAFVPVPAWWQTNFWNTNAVWEAATSSFLLKALAMLISAGALALVFFVQAKSKKALLFFGSNVVFMMGVAMLFPLSNARYVGFIYIGFFVSLWLNRDELFSDPARKTAIYVLLLLQVAGTLVVVPQEWSRPFSQVREIKNTLAQVPQGQNVVTDYWGLNYLSAVTNTGYYCIESKEIQTCLILNNRWRASLENPHRHTEGMLHFLAAGKHDTVFFLCMMPPEELNQKDTDFNKTFVVTLMAAKTGAIEKFSNVYLYRVTTRKTANSL